MIKSNWAIKNLIMSYDLIFKQIRPMMIWFDLESDLSLQFWVKEGKIKL
jgi:hypothetical protein